MNKELVGLLPAEEFALVSREQAVRIAEEAEKFSVLMHDCTPPCLGEEVALATDDTDEDTGKITMVWFDDEADLFEVTTPSGNTFYLCEDELRYDRPIAPGDFPSYGKYLWLKDFPEELIDPYIHSVYPGDRMMALRRTIADAGVRMVMADGRLYLCTKDEPERVKAFWDVLQKIGFVMPKDEKKG